MARLAQLIQSKSQSFCYFDFFRNNFYPKELQNTKGAQAILQRNKAVKERKTRHPFATGAYGIKAMNKRTQRLIIDKLRTSLPEDSRFFQLL